LIFTLFFNKKVARENEKRPAQQITLLCGRSYDLMDVQGDQRPKTLLFLFYKDIRHDPRWAEISLFFIRLFGCGIKVWKRQKYIFDKNQASASLLTCRRRLVDTPQTLTQPLPQTLIEQKER